MKVVSEFDVSSSQFEGHTPLANAQRSIVTGTVEKLGVSWPPCVLELAFGTPNKLKIPNLKLKYKVKVKISAHGLRKSRNPTRTTRLVIILFVWAKQNYDRY